ncbi:MAG: class I SAM-dependent methyltransferase [Methanomicrobiales archaeon]
MPLLKLDGHERILDIGCGDGRITAEIASKISEGCVLGIDNSIEMIKLAKESFSIKEFSNLKFKVMDACELNFQEDFHRIFSNAHFTG